MILSFHPCYVGDVNRICAGRAPDAEDEKWIVAADAVVLPQGCRRDLYEMAAAHCTRIFPDYAARFAYPGKIGQIRLFEKTGAPHPETHVFPDLEHFHRRHGMPPLCTDAFAFPFVFKFDWSGEGANVWRVDSAADFTDMLNRAARFEKTGQTGFLIQQYIETGGRSLRVAVIGKTVITYWRAQPNPEQFKTGIAEGAIIDWQTDPDLQAAGRQLITDFCADTGINLAGFDLLFDETRPKKSPLLLEINYFFGRKGLGGSDRFYERLCTEIDRWRSESGV